MKISERIRSIRPSATMEVTARAIALRAEGVDVISFGAGEPDFDTPDHVKEAAVESLRRGETKYTAVGGTAALKKAIVDKLRRDNGLEYSVDDVVVSCGGKHSLYNTILSLFEEGDEVIVPVPCWVSYPDMIALAGAKCVPLPAPAEKGFKITPDDLRQAITPRTRGFVFNSPSNPTGVAYDDDEVAALLEVLREHPDVVVISDDVYERILYDGRTVPKHPGVLAPDLRDRLVISNSVSKTYAMTGWRIGYTVADQSLVKAITKLQGQSTSGPAAMAQAAAATALSGPQECVTRMLDAFRQRRDFVVRRLGEIRGVRVVNPNGAFYVFPHVADHFGKRWKDREIRSGTDLALYLLEEANVALVGGDGFSAPEHVRLSYATSMENLEKGLERVEQALARLG